MISYREPVLLADPSFLERNGTLFQIVAGVLIAAVTGLVTWYLNRRNKTSKTFDYRLGGTLPILLHRPDNDALKVTYLNEEVRNPRIVLVHFRNTGKQVIKADEFLNPYVITLQGARLLDTNIAGKSAPNLVEVLADGHDPQAGKVQLSVATLNPGDGFTVQMVVDSDVDPQVVVRGRIENQTRATQIYPLKSELRDNREWMNIFGPFGVLLVVVGAFALNGGKPNSLTGGLVVGGLGALFLALGCVTWFVARRNLRARLRRSAGSAL
jgi:hypothetical protein